MEQFVLEIVYIKEIQNTVKDAISWLDYNPKVKVNPTNEFDHAPHGIPKKESNHHKMKDFLMAIVLLQWKQPQDTS